MKTFHLKRTMIAAYALPAIPMSALGLPLSVYLPPLYAEHTLLAVGMVGTLFFIARLFDIVTDPVFGAISDRLTTPFGRRRPWLVAAAPILMLSVFMLFNPPEDAGAPYLLGWLFVLYLGFTFFTLSHMSWGAELSANYDERARVQGWREFALIGGMLTVLVIPAFINLFVKETSSREDAAIMSTFILVMLPVTVGLAVFLVPDPNPKSVPTQGSVLRSLRTIVRNPFLPRTLAADLLQGIGPAITGALYVWLAVFYLDLAPYRHLILLAYFAAALAGLPIWMQVSYRIGKHATFAVAMIYSAGLLSTYFFAPVGNLPAALVLTVCYGLAYGAGSFLLRAMMADVVDYDRMSHRETRTGIYFSLLTLTGKFGTAFGPLIAYNFLDYVGFDPKAAASADVAYWVLIAFTVPPIIVFFMAAATMLRFPLTRTVQESMRLKIAALEAEESAGNDAAVETFPPRRTGAQSAH